MDMIIISSSYVLIRHLLLPQDSERIESRLFGCLGKVLIDDVWSGGSKDGKSPETGIKYPLMSKAVAAGLYHPRCRDSHTTYFEGISTPPDDKYTREELNKLVEKNRQEARQQYAGRQAEKLGRLAKYSLDEDNQDQYERKASVWKRVRFRTGDISSGEYVESKRPLADFHAIPQERAVEIMRKDAEEWLAELTNEEKRSIQKYTYNSGDRKPNRFFERMNAMLRGDATEDEKLRNFANTISNAIKKNKLKKDVIAYRGVDIDPTNGAEVGKIIIPGQFYSTSIVNTRSFDSVYQLVIYVKKGSSAAYIEELSYFPKQRELLIDKDCFYRVISRKENIIELEVL